MDDLKKRLNCSLSLKVGHKSGKNSTKKGVKTAVTDVFGKCGAVSIRAELRVEADRGKTTLDLF